MAPEKLQSMDQVTAQQLAISFNESFYDTNFKAAPRFGKDGWYVLVGRK